jgi:hypothetical protein
MEVSASIDEAGRGRQVAVEGLSEAALRGCLERATAYLALPAPDTGTARARWVVRFVANAEKSSPTREPRHIAASTSP